VELLDETLLDVVLVAIPLFDETLFDETLLEDVLLEDVLLDDVLLEVLDDFLTSSPHAIAVAERSKTAMNFFMYQPLEGRRPKSRRQNLGRI
jgi:hypothetical protein